MDDIISNICIAVMVIVGGFLLLILGAITGRNMVREQAIENGYARYEVDNKENTSFVWNDCTYVLDPLKAENANSLKGEVKE